MSAAVRKRIGYAQRKRWAVKRGAVAASKTPARPQRKLRAAVWAAIVAALKKRLAAKNAGPTVIRRLLYPGNALLRRHGLRAALAAVWAHRRHYLFIQAFRHVAGRKVGVGAEIVHGENGRPFSRRVQESGGRLPANHAHDLVKRVSLFAGRKCKDLVLSFTSTGRQGSGSTA